MAGIADADGDERPQAAITRASVALAQMRRLRTWFPPGGQPPRTRRGKQTARSFRAVARGRVAGVGVQVSWLAARRPQPAFPRPSPQGRLLDEAAPLTVARELRHLTGFPWYPVGILAPDSPDARTR